MSGLSKQLIDEMNSNDVLYKRLVEWFGVDAELARTYVKNLSFSKYNRLMEATVDRNPSLTSGTTTSGDPRYNDDLSDIEDLIRGGNADSEEPSSEPPNSSETPHNNVDDFDPDYLPAYIKNAKGDIDYKKIQQGDRIAYVDDYGKVLHGVVSSQDGQGNYDIDTHRGMHSGIEQGRLRTPRELAWRYKSKMVDDPKQKGKDAMNKASSQVSGTMDKMDALSQVESIDDELSELRDLAGVSETCSAGATGAGAIASGPSVIGDIDKRPSTDLQVRARKDRDNKKKRKKRAQGKEVK